MAAIGAIRKHGVLLMVIIGIALLAFLLGDFTKLSTFFSDKYTMAKVDDEKIDAEYRLQYEQNTALWKLFYNKSSLDETETYQIHEMTWNQIIEDQLLNQQLEDLGLIYTDEMVETVAAEMLASLRTQQPNQLLAQMVNILAEQLGAENAISLISSIEDYKNEESAKEIYNAYKAIERFAVSEKKRMSYFALAQNTIYFSDPLAEQLAKDNKNAMVQLISLNPLTAAFNDVVPTISDKEMKSWYKEHKEQYRVKHDVRDIDVAVFPILPTNEDLKNIEDSVRSAYHRFVNAPSLVAFNVTEMFGPVDSAYYKKEDITLDVLDTLIFDRPVGSMIEPFTYENAMWYYGKVYGSSLRPDSLQLAFLVVDFKSDQNPNGTRNRKQAKAEADSLQNLIAAGQKNVFELLPNYLSGRKAADTTLWLEERTTIPVLYDTLLKTPNGGLYTFEASSAYVVYQVLNRSKLIEKRQFVIYPYEITASEATIKTIKSNANQLAGEATNADALIDIANSKGIQVVKGVNVGSMTATISQLNNCRDIVSWAFAKETKKDAISDVVNIDNKMYAVAVLRDIKNKGIPKFEEVKSDVEKELMTKKKIEMIETKVKEELSKGVSMDQLASKYNSPLMDSVMLSFDGDTYQN
ncbi:MAG: SurA N-terminal domain-containing protein, partial [Bacteroidales bacterium]